MSSCCASNGRRAGRSCRVSVLAGYASGEEALAHCLAGRVPQAILMDVALAGEMNGIAGGGGDPHGVPAHAGGVLLDQDDDRYYRDFRQSGILSHYAYVRSRITCCPG